jgi:hypothetical protein
VQTSKHEEVVFNLRVTPARGGQGWSALLDSGESGTQIRFRDLQTLMRYLQALSDTRPSRGLR